MAWLPLWLAFLRVQLWRGPSPRDIRSTARYSLGSAAFGAILIYAGIATLQAAERSAAHGGGLLGGIRLFFPSASAACWRASRAQS